MQGREGRGWKRGGERENRARGRISGEEGKKGGRRKKRGKREEEGKDSEEERRGGRGGRSTVWSVKIRILPERISHFVPSFMNFATYEAISSRTHHVFKYSYFW